MSTRTSTVQFPLRFGTRDVEDVLAKVNHASTEVSTGEHDSLTFDLTGIQWIDLFPLGMLVLWLTEASKLGCPVEVALPAVKQNKDGTLKVTDQQRVLAFLRKWGFISMCRRLTNVQVSHPLAAWEMRMPEFDDEEDPVNSFVHDIASLTSLPSLELLIDGLTREDSYVRKRLLTDVKLDRIEFAAHAHILVRELGKNIFDHQLDKADVQGWLCYRILKPFRDAPTREARLRARKTYSAPWEWDLFQYAPDVGYLEIAMGDNGYGIIHTLRKAAERHGFNDPVGILKYAFDEYSTRRDEPEHRMRGLYCVLEHVSELRGMLYVRNGSCALSFDCRNAKKPVITPYDTRLNDNPGVQYQILIPLIEREVLKDTMPRRRAKQKSPPTPLPQFEPILLYNMERHRTLAGLRGREALLLELPRLVANIPDERVGIFDFRHIHWTREQCHRLLKGIWDGLSAGKQLIGVNASDEMKTYFDHTEIRRVFERNHYVFLIADEKPFWVGLRSNDDSECEVIGTWSACYEVPDQSSGMIAEARERLPDTQYLDMIDYCNKNTTLFWADDSNPQTRRQYRFRFDPFTLNQYRTEELFRLALRDQIENDPHVMHRRAKTVFELPWGRYAEFYVELRRLFDDNEFGKSVVQRFVGLFRNESSITHALAYTEVGGRLAAAVASQTDINVEELGDRSALDQYRANLPYISGDRVLIITDLVGTGKTAETIMDMVRATGATPHKIAAVVNTDSQRRVLQGVPIESLISIQCRYHDQVPDDHSVFRLGREHPSLTETPISESLLTPMQFWTMVQRAQALHPGHRRWKGHVYRLWFLLSRVLSEEKSQETIVEAVAKRLQNQDNEYPFVDYVLIPSETDSEAIHFSHSLDIITQGAPILTESGIPEDFAEMDAGKTILIFDTSARTGTSIRRLLSRCPVNSDIYIVVVVNRLSPKSSRSLFADREKHIKDFIALYNVNDDAFLDSEDRDLDRTMKEFKTCRTKVFAHRMLEYIDQILERLGAEVHVQSHVDEFDTRKLPHVSSTDLDINRYHDEVKNMTPEAQLEFILTRGAEGGHAQHCPQPIFDNPTLRGVILDYSYRIRDMTVILDLYPKVQDKEVRSLLLEHNILGKRPNASPEFSPIAEKKYLDLLLAGLRECTEQAQIDIHLRTISRLSPGYFIRHIDDILEKGLDNSRTRSSLSLELATITESKVRADMLRRLRSYQSRISEQPDLFDRQRHFDYLLGNIGFTREATESAVREMTQAEKLDKLFNEDFPLETVLAHLIERISEAIRDVPLSTIWQRVPGRDSFILVAASHHTYRKFYNHQAYGSQAELAFPLSEPILIKDIWDEEEVQRQFGRANANPAQPMEEFRSYAMTKGYKSLSIILAPILLQDGHYRVCRIIRLWNSKRNCLTEQHIAEFQSLLDPLKKAPDFYLRKRWELAHDKERQETILKKLMLEVASDRSGDEKLDHVCQIIADHFNVLMAGILLYSQQQHALVRRAAIGPDWDEEARRRVIPLTKECLSTISFNKGRIQKSRDVQEDPLAIPPNQHVHACVTVPLKCGDQPQGVLTLWSEVEDYFMNVDDSLIWELAGYAALVVPEILQAEEGRREKELFYRAAVRRVTERTAHRLGNELRPVAEELSIIQAKVRRGKPIEEIVESLRRAKQRVNSAKAVLRRVQDISKIITPRLTASPLEKLVERAFADSKLSQEAYQIDTGGKSWLCTVDQSYMEEDVFRELIQNSLTMGGEHMEVRFQAHTLNGTDAVRIVVSDDGPGVQDSMKERIFEGYYSYRPDGEKGTGVGLYHVRRIIEAHGGKISEIGESKKGATFEIILPRLCETTLSSKED